MQANITFLAPARYWNVYERSNDSDSHHDSKNGAGCNNTGYAGVPSVAAANATRTENRTDVHILAWVFVSLPMEPDLHRADELTAY